MTRKATSNDVARLAGVSRSAVSLVLNGRAEGLIAADKQKAILAAARKLDYSPNSVALSLRTQQTRTIGLVTDSIASGGFGGQMIKGAFETAVAAGYFLVLVDADNSDDRVVGGFATLLERQVDALMFAALSLRPFAAPQTMSARPAVMVNAFDPAGVITSVVPDEEQGGRSAAELLINTGHTRIAMLRGGTEDPVAAELRVKGYRTAMRAAGLRARRPVIAGWQIEEGYRAAASILDGPDRPTGVICANDRVALGVLLAAGERGLRVPDDLSLVGYDDDRNVAAHVVPPLTTVRIPFEQLGVRAMELLLAGLAGEGVPQGRVYLDCPPVVRGSVAPPADS